MASLNAYTQSLTRKQAAHLLRRSGFGPTIEEIDQFENMTPSQAMDILFHLPENDPAPPVDTKTLSSWANPPVQYVAGKLNSDQDVLHNYFKAWHSDVMLKSGTSIRERIVWFYHTHLPARWTKINSSEAIYYQNCLFRYYAFGSFKELFRKICVDNAMLVYLDGATNHKDDPNENFAREMLELYSIGKGPQIPGGEYTNYTYYTELDVKSATKILTGWIFDETFQYTDPDTGIPSGKLATVSQGNPPVLLATGHSTLEKQFSEAFNSKKIITGEIIENLATAEAAEAELDELIDMIFGQIETARFLLRKMYRFFVYHFISDEVEQDIIVPLAQQFYDSNYDVPSILKKLLSSQHFFDADNSVSTDDNIGALIKSPLELNLGLLKFFNTEVPDRYTSAAAFYQGMAYINNSFIDQGLAFYEPFEVAGYPAYHQIPSYNRNWITAYSLVNRYQVGMNLLRTNGNAEELNFGIDILNWVENSGHIGNPGNAEEIVSVITDNLLGIELNQERFDYFLNTVFLDTFNPSTWQYEWQKYTGGGDSLIVKDRLEYFLATLTQTPEFQVY